MKKIKQLLQLKLPKKQVYDIKNIKYTDKKSKEERHGNVGSFKLIVDNTPVYVKVFNLVENEKNYNCNFTVNFSKDITAIGEYGTVYEIAPEELITSIRQYVQKIK